MMETGVPGNSQVGNSTTKVVYNQNYIQTGRRMPGFLGTLAFMTLLGGLVLAIISIVQDDLTKVTFYDGTASHFTEYCGWKQMHSYNNNGGYPGTAYTFKYSNHCNNDNRACTTEKVGKAFYSLLIIGIVFAGLALIPFISDVSAPLTYLFIMACELLFFGCMLADALIWGLFPNCSHYCKHMSFPNLPTDITGCHSKFASSWILVVIAGGLALLSMFFLSLHQCLCRKRY